MARILVFLSMGLGFFPVLISGELDGQEAASPSKKEVITERRMFVDPSSTTVALNVVRLIVRPLTRKGEFYVGDYELKVFPYVAKSETGTLKLDAPDEMVRKFSEGTELDFTGKATNNKGGKAKLISGTISPSANDKGRLTFFLGTDNGQMTFKTSYHFAD